MTPGGGEASSAMSVHDHKRLVVRLNMMASGGGRYLRTVSLLRPFLRSPRMIRTSLRIDRVRRTQPGGTAEATTYHFCSMAVSSPYHSSITASFSALDPASLKLSSQRLASPTVTGGARDTFGWDPRSCSTTSSTSGSWFNPFARPEVPLWWPCSGYL